MAGEGTKQAMIPARPSHWQRLRRSLGRRWREWRLPASYVRLGTRYGGWWLDSSAVRADPLVIDCGLGEDISFDVAFLARFGGRVIGIDPNPASLAWCRERCPPGMELRDRAFWTAAGATLTFHLPRPKAQLPEGADGVSGSLRADHPYVGGGETRQVQTTSLEEVLAGREECDVLKLDIEGAEFEVLAELVRRGELRRCRQLLVEFHRYVAGEAATERALAGILAAGFRLAHVESKNYLFRRGDLG